MYRGYAATGFESIVLRVMIVAVMVEPRVSLSVVFHGGRNLAMLLIEGQTLLSTYSIQSTKEEVTGNVTIISGLI